MLNAGAVTPGRTAELFSPLKITLEEPRLLVYSDLQLLFPLVQKSESSLSQSGFEENHHGNQSPLKNLPHSRGEVGDGWGGGEQPEVAGRRRRENSVNKMSNSWSGCFEGNRLRM